MRRAVALAFLLVLSLNGCMGALTSESSSDNGSVALMIDPPLYRDTFDVAVRTAREMGYKIEIVDRSNGIIETNARHAGGLLEPWRIDNDGLSEATANTATNRRRRIRFEFIPVGATLGAVQADPILRGPAIPGSTIALDRFDVQNCTTPITVEVSVFLERSFVEGTNPSINSGSLASTWTNRLNTKPLDSTDESSRDFTKWTPVGRDTAYEATILERMARSLGPA